MIGYISVGFSILFTALGQIMLKWRLSLLKSLPSGFGHKLLFLVNLIFTDPFIFFGFVFAFVASLFWLNALNKLELNVAYPMMSLSFVLVFLFSSYFFHEKIHWLQVCGLAFILLGVSLIGLVPGRINGY
jgi:multidrug transporter EmrE-like cation transporter